MPWTTITDFSPGIWSNNGNLGYTGPIIGAPLGSAQADKTYQCVALPSGALAPGPWYRLSDAKLPVTTQGTGGETFVFCSAFLAIGPWYGGKPPFNDTIFSLIDYYTSSVPDSNGKFWRNFELGVGSYKIDTAKLNVSQTTLVATQNGGSPIAFTLANPVATTQVPCSNNNEYWGSSISEIALVPQGTATIFPPVTGIVFEWTPLNGEIYAASNNFLIPGFSLIPGYGACYCFTAASQPNINGYLTAGTITLPVVQSVFNPANPPDWGNWSNLPGPLPPATWGPITAPYAGWNGAPIGITTNNPDPNYISNIYPLIGVPTYAADYPNPNQSSAAINIENISGAMFVHQDRIIQLGNFAFTPGAITDNNLILEFVNEAIFMSQPNSTQYVTEPYGTLEYSYVVNTPQNLGNPNPLTNTTDPNSGIPAPPPTTTVTGNPVFTFPLPGGPTQGTSPTTATASVEGNAFTITSFDASNPSGYGSWASLNAGELLLVKKSRGAVHISGDMMYPTVRTLPAVKSTGNLMGKAVSTPIGSIYMSELAGAWCWSGGDTSTKVSQQLSDNFYDDNNLGLVIENIGWVGEYWNDYFVCSNNYMLDLNSKGWWRLLDPTTALLHHFSAGSSSAVLYACSLGYPVPYTGSTPYRNEVFSFYSALNAPYYSWLSHPIPLSTDPNQPLDSAYLVTKILLKVTGPGSISTTVYGEAGSSQKVTQSADSDEPVTLRFDFGVRATDATVRLEATGSGENSAPIIHSMSIEWEPVGKVPTH